MHVCVCVCVHVCMHAYVRVCVYEKEGERRWCGGLQGAAFFFHGTNSVFALLQFFVVQSADHHYLLLMLGL